MSHYNERYEDKKRHFEMIRLNRYQQQQQQQQQGDDQDYEIYNEGYDEYTQHNEYYDYDQHQYQHQHGQNQYRQKPISYDQVSYDGTNDYKEERSRERTRNIRDMNNWCKYVNITHSIKESFNENNGEKIKILDLGCGKGNDLLKYRGNKKYIKKCLGIDLSMDAIIGARKKYEKILQENIKHRNASWEERKKFGLQNAYGQTAKEFYDGPFFDAQFICQDMNNPNLGNHQLINHQKPFNLINIQFALYHSFTTKRAFNALLNTIEQSTASGSYFLCSFVRDNIIINRLQQSLKQQKIRNNNDYIVFQNQFQFIKMKQSDFQYIITMYDKHNLLHFDPNTLYESKQQENDSKDIDNCVDGLIGIPYKYYQMDCVESDNDDNDGVEEYFISFAVLCKLLYHHCKMKLIYMKTASDIYIECSRKFPYRYGYSKGRELDNVQWTKHEQQVIDTYGYALFQRS